MYRSEIAGAVHEMMEGFHAVGLIGEKTMQEFDASCLIPAISDEKVETQIAQDHTAVDGRFSAMHEIRERNHAR